MKRTDQMRVNEIFHSLQGEGFHTGVASVFVRLAGCNIKCPFCDTDHASFTEMTEEEIAAKVAEYGTRHVVITGGEPTLQLNAKLIDLLHNQGNYVQIETNGSIRISEECHVDWITCSPKAYAEVKLQRVDEWKLLYHGDNQKDIEHFASLPAKCYSLQPLDTQDKIRNEEILKQTINYILTHPQWRLSLQTHKMIGVR